MYVYIYFQLFLSVFSTQKNSDYKEPSAPPDFSSCSLNGQKEKEYNIFSELSSLPKD